MFLHINDRMTIEEVQDRFHECFPNLEIAFYSAPLRGICLHNDSFRLAQYDRIEYVRQYHYNGALEIKSWFPVARVEQELKEMFDLNARIFHVGNDREPIELLQYDELLRKQ